MLDRALPISEALDTCTSALNWVCSPAGPNDPFGTWYLALFDLLRIVCYVGALILILTTPYFMRFAFSMGQRMRFLGQACYAVAVIGTELEHLGDNASYRLIVNVVAVCASLYGLWYFYKYDQRGLDEP